MTDLDLAAVLIATLAAYRLVERLRLVRRDDRNQRAERVRNIYHLPYETRRTR